MTKYFLTTIAILVNFISQTRAQDIVQTKQYPKGVFRYPLDLMPSTAGSFGELRASHFHSGLDFKTNQRIGYPVHAVLDGYVSRVKVQYGGFGYAVYIDHPNGFTSVYGHLDHFDDKITQLVKQEQARQQKWDVDIILQPLQIPVYKGQVFAWSGNRGASGGPHVHFELRDTKTQETINAQLFGLTIPDRVPPTITGISIYHLNNRPFSESTPRQSYAVRGAKGSYHLASPHVIDLSGNTGFGISAYDVNSASVNHNGVYSVELKVDGQTVYTFAAERFAFDQTHAINAYIDYPYFLRTRSFIEKCLILPGSRISLYPQSINRGIVDFNDELVHDVEFVVKDVAGNTSTIALKIKSSPVKDEVPYKPQGTLVKYNQHTEIDKGNMKLIVEPYNLYDDVDMDIAVLPKRPGSFSETYRIHNRYTPIHDSLNLWIKPDTTIARFADKAVIVNTATGYIESVYDNGYVKGKMYAFGNYDVRVDTVAPVIRPVNIHNGSNMARQRSIRLRVNDNISGVKSYLGKIDDKWVLVEHDYKSKMFIYTFDGAIAPGKHTFVFTATDDKNNVSQFTADFYR